VHSKWFCISSDVFVSINWYKHPGSSKAHRCWCPCSWIFQLDCLMLRHSESEMNYSFCGLRLFKNAKTLLFIVKDPACISIPYHTHWQRLSHSSTPRLRRSFWSHYRCHSLVWSSWQKQMRQWCYWEFVPLSFNHVWSINVNSIDAFCVFNQLNVSCMFLFKLCDTNTASWRMDESCHLLTVAFRLLRGSRAALNWKVSL